MSDAITYFAGIRAEEKAKADAAKESALKSIVADAQATVKSEYEAATKDGRISSSELRSIDRADKRATQAETRMQRQGFEPPQDKKLDSVRREVANAHVKARSGFSTDASSNLTTEMVSDIYWDTEAMENLLVTYSSDRTSYIPSPIPTPIPATGTHVLGVIDGVIQWIATEAC